MGGLKNFDPISGTPGRSESIASSDAVSYGALIEFGRVVTVNVKDFTLDVRVLNGEKAKFDITFMSPYCSQIQGEGINFMPEVGSTCWVCTPSDDKYSKAFVMGWTMVPESGKNRGGRQFLNPGDLHFSTRDGNFVFLRRGGIVQIGSTALCQRVYLPIRNIIQDYAENYELHAVGGDLTWTVARKEEDGGGHQMCLFSLAAKEFSDDPNEDTIGLLKFGSHGEGNDTILSLLTRDSGGGTQMTSLEVNKAGEITWTFKKLELHVEGDAKATIDGLFQLIVGGAIDISAVAAMTVSAASFSLAAGGAVFNFTGSGFGEIDAAQLTLCQGQWPVVRASPDFMTWVSTVTALLIGPPSPPVPAMRGPIIPPLAHTNPKVKV
jgi:hypothetical protein